MRIEPLEFEFVIVNDLGRIVSREMGQLIQVVFDIGGGQQLVMASLTGGEFLMGSAASEGYADEKPQHRVNVLPFLIGRFPITQAQWRAVMKTEKPCRFCGEDKAMHNVSWPEAVEFCRNLSAVTGQSFRLPSEAEWEYACRGGATTPFSTGATITTDLANYNGAFIYGQAPQGSYRHVLLDAGVFPPNAFGLYDMHGNLWEWCGDPWHENYEGAPENGRVWDERGNDRCRMVRGGSWHETPDLCRSAARLKLPADEGDEMVGFRVAMDAFNVMVATQVN